MPRSPALEVVAIGAPAPAATTVVLLHGFGAPGDDLVGLAGALTAPPDTRFVMPAAPLALPGLYGDARAWWMLDLARIERALAGIVDDRSDEVPDGLLEARALIAGLVDDLYRGGTKRVVLGGFSQGAMLALDTLLHIDHPIAGLAFLSGTRINAAAWRARLARVKELPVVMSHGTADPLLPFAAAASLRDELRGAGADVDWIEFAGGHEIPQTVLAGVNRLLARPARPAPA
jgi:phospholipase/carboxylesterase